MNRTSLPGLLCVGFLFAPSPARAQTAIQAQTRDRLSEAREFTSAVSVGSEALFAGGFAYGIPSDIVDIFDADTERWSTANLSIARLGHVGVVAGPVAMFAGGQAATGIVDRVDLYDSATGSWTTDQLSTPRGFGAAASNGSRAFFAGGAPVWPPSSSSDVVDVYDTETQGWSQEQLSAPRAFLAAASVGDEVLFAGGIDYTTGAVYDTVDIYDVNAGTWTQAQLSVPRYVLVATTVGSKVLFAGGVDVNGQGLDAVDIYDSATGNWTATNLFEARTWLAATTVGDKALFGGGYSAFAGPGNLFDTVDVYDCSSDSWSQETLSQARLRASAATVRGRAMFAGGAAPGQYSYVVDFFDYEVGASYCGPGEPNSTGASASVWAIGSSVAADSDVVLSATELPPGKFGYFLVSQTQGFLANPGGSQGNLCLAGSIGRYLRPGEVQVAGLGGQFSLTLDLTDTPQPSGPVNVLAGETWNFTAWYRDVNPSQTSNFTDAVSVAFE